MHYVNRNIDIYANYYLQSSPLAISNRDDLSQFHCSGYSVTQFQTYTICVRFIFFIFAVCSNHCKRGTNGTQVLILIQFINNPSHAP